MLNLRDLSSEMRGKKEKETPIKKNMLKFIRHDSRASRQIKGVFVHPTPSILLSFLKGFCEEKIVAADLSVIVVYDQTKYLVHPTLGFV